MNATSDQERHIAMLQAALPYVSPDKRKGLELYLQTNLLLKTAMGVREEEYTLSAAETGNTFVPDPENLLLHIQEYCTPKEADTLHTLLNVIRAHKLFHGYQEFRQERVAGEASFSDDSPLSANSLGNENQFLDFLISKLAPDKRATFEQFKQIMYNDGQMMPERTSND